jgi:hypothetical protein
MQVGMIANDGIVLASDTRSSREPLPNAPEGSVWYRYASSKIRIADSGKVAVTCARDMMLASYLAEALLAGLTPEFWTDPEPKMREIGSAEIASRGWREAECLVALVDPLPALFHLQCLNQGADSFCPRITDFAFAGDRTNSAIFWAMRYYGVRPVESRSAQSLIPLAAQIVTDAGELNSGSIGGLEVVYSDAAGFHRLTDSESRTLEIETESRGMRIQEVLFGLAKHI